MDLSTITMYQACLLHSRSERVLKSLVARSLVAWKITRMEWLLLATVATEPKRSEGHTMGEIAEILDIRLSQLTALVNGMTQQGLLEQKTSASDRRTKFLNVTSRGVKFLETIEQDLRAAMRKWLADIPRADLQTYMLTVKILGDDVRLK